VCSLDQSAVQVSRCQVTAGVIPLHLRGNHTRFLIFMRPWNTSYFHYLVLPNVSVVAFQIYCGKLPKDLFEDSLIPLFENIGAIWDLRLMMDPVSGHNRGYCFVTFTEKKAAEEAVKQVSNLYLLVFILEIREYV